MRGTCGINSAVFIAEKTAEGRGVRRSVKVDTSREIPFTSHPINFAITDHQSKLKVLSRIHSAVVLTYNLNRHL